MDKFQKVLSLLKNHYKDKVKINYSPSSGYRSRCEFGYKNNFYTMYSSLGEKPKDLLELYCGSGTFSVPMRKLFNKILATENNRQSIRCLNQAIKENNINNIFHARLSAEEVTELFNGRVFKRMNNIDINNFDFSHILVDPPRAGLDNNVINLIKKFDNVLYISCNYETYIRDIEKLKNFKVINIEIFDQFPNTKHIEIVSLLSKSNLNMFK